MMKAILFNIWNLVFLAISLSVGFFGWNGVAYSDFEPVIDSLQDISVMVFTIMGIWVAFIYPSALQAITNPDKVSMIEGTEKTRRLEGLVMAIIVSASVLLAILLFTYIHMILENKGVFDQKNIMMFSVSFITYLCLVQSKAVFEVIVSNINFVNELHDKRNKKIMDDDL